jgi:hypothetical protein
MTDSQDHRSDGDYRWTASTSSPYPDAPVVDVGSVEAPPADTVFDDYAPPADLPPWYEDDYYDEDEWDRLPRRTSTAFRVVAFTAVLLVALLVAYSYVKGWIDDQLDPPGDPGSELVIEIPQGTTTNDIARILADEGVVANGTVFRYYLRFKDAPDFQAGVYTFRENSAVWDVRDVLETGPATAPDTRTFITVPEGLTIAEMREVLLGQLPLFDRAELDAALAAPVRPRTLGEDRLFLSYEGVFYPETYDVDRHRDRSGEPASRAGGYTVRRVDHRLAHRGGGQSRRGPSQDRAGHLQPDRERHAAGDRRDRGVRARW